MTNQRDDDRFRTSIWFDLPKEPIKPDLYSVKRKFDLATMLTGTTGFALMFAGLRLLGAPVGLVGFFGGLILTVAAAQALLFAGENPRGASLLAGLAYCIIATWAARWMAFNSPTDRMLVGGCGFAAAVLFGAPAGYIAGALAAGVFLVSEKVRELLTLVRLSKAPANDSTASDSPWDEGAED